MNQTVSHIPNTFVKDEPKYIPDHPHYGDGSSPPTSHHIHPEYNDNKTSHVDTNVSNQQTSQDSLNSTLPSEHQSRFDSKELERFNNLSLDEKRDELLNNPLFPYLLKAIGHVEKNGGFAPVPHIHVQPSQKSIGTTKIPDIQLSERDAVFLEVLAQSGHVPSQQPKPSLSLLQNDPGHKGSILSQVTPSSTTPISQIASFTKPSPALLPTTTAGVGVSTGIGVGVTPSVVPSVVGGSGYSTTLPSSSSQTTLFAKPTTPISNFQPQKIDHPQSVSIFPNLRYPQYQHQHHQSQPLQPKHQPIGAHNPLHAMSSSSPLHPHGHSAVPLTNLPILTRPNTPKTTIDQSPLVSKSLTSSSFASTTIPYSRSPTPIGSTPSQSPAITSSHVVGSTNMTPILQGMSLTKPDISQYQLGQRTTLLPHSTPKSYLIPSHLYSHVHDKSTEYSVLQNNPYNLITQHSAPSSSLPIGTPSNPSIGKPPLSKLSLLVKNEEQQQQQQQHQQQYQHQPSIPTGLLTDSSGAIISSAIAPTSSQLMSDSAYMAIEKEFQSTLHKYELSHLNHRLQSVQHRIEKALYRATQLRCLLVGEHRFYYLRVLLSKLALALEYIAHRPDQVTLLVAQGNNANTVGASLSSFPYPQQPSISTPVSSLLSSQKAVTPTSTPTTQSFATKMKPLLSAITKLPDAPLIRMQYLLRISSMIYSILTQQPFTSTAFPLQVNDYNVTGSGLSTLPLKTPLYPPPSLQPTIVHPSARVTSSVGAAAPQSSSSSSFLQQMNPSVATSLALQHTAHGYHGPYAQSPLKRLTGNINALPYPHFYHQHQQQQQQQQLQQQQQQQHQTPFYHLTPSHHQQPPQQPQYTHLHQYPPHSQPPFHGYVPSSQHPPKTSGITTTHPHSYPHPHPHHGHPHHPPAPNQPQYTSSYPPPLHPSTPKYVTDDELDDGEENVSDDSRRSSTRLQRKRKLSYDLDQVTGYQYHGNDDYYGYDYPADPYSADSTPRSQQSRRRSTLRPRGNTITDSSYPPSPYYPPQDTRRRGASSSSTVSLGGVSHVSLGDDGADDQGYYQDSPDQPSKPHRDPPKKSSSQTIINSSQLCPLTDAEIVQAVELARENVKNINSRGGSTAGARSLNSKAIDILREWLFQNFKYPYPSDDDKAQLAQITGLTTSQVNYWFINSRVRIYKPAVKAIMALRKKRD